MRDANAENTSCTDIQLFDGNWTAVAQDPFFVEFVPPLPPPLPPPLVDDDHDADAYGEDVQPAQPATTARAEYTTPSARTIKSPRAPSSSENSGKRRLLSTCATLISYLRLRYGCAY